MNQETMNQLTVNTHGDKKGPLERIKKQRIIKKQKYRMNLEVLIIHKVHKFHKKK